MIELSNLDFIMEVMTAFKTLQKKKWIQKYKMNSKIVIYNLTVT